MKQIIAVQNLKCGGCAKTITNKLNSIQGISQVSVDPDKSIIEFYTYQDKLIEEVKDALTKLGYPELSQENDLGKKVKSYVSCMVGRMN